MAVKQVAGSHREKSFFLSSISSAAGDGVDGRHPMALETGSGEGGTMRMSRPYSKMRISDPGLMPYFLRRAAGMTIWPLLRTFTDSMQYSACSG